MEAMTKEDRTFMPAAVVPSYQNSFIRKIAEINERPLAYYIRLAFDLLIENVRRNEPRLYERVYNSMPAEDRALLDAVGQDDPPTT